MIKDYTKIGICAVLFIFLVFVVVQTVKFSGREREARAEYDEVKEEFDRTQADHQTLREELSYYSNQDNLAKELRARFNYTLPGEKILILVQEAPVAEDR
jgi:cell division protein FtsB